MNFRYYSELTVAGCYAALDERLKKGSKVTGWADKHDKGVRFSLAVTTQVLGRFNKATRLSGEIARENGLTIVTGYVPDGMTRSEQVRTLGALAVVALLLIVVANALLPAMLAVVIGVALFIMTTADAVNSAALLSEVQRTLKAKSKPAKAESGKTASATPTPKAGTTKKATTPAASTSASKRAEEKNDLLF